MRPIKFRAWDEEIEEYFYTNKDYDDHWFNFEKGKLKAFGLTEPMPSGDPYSPPEPKCYELEESEQFTGLHDKNGKEIYEGDIIKRITTAEQLKTGVVVYYVSSFNIKFSERHMVFLDNNYEVIYEVIGNIHEKPELLENK